MMQDLREQLREDSVELSDDLKHFSVVRFLSVCDIGATRNEEFIKRRRKQSND